MDHDRKMKRRDLVRLLLGTPLALGAGRAAAQQFAPPPLPPQRLPRSQSMFLGPEVPERPSFFFTQLSYGDGLTWNPYPTAARSLMDVLVQRTSIAASSDRVDLKATDPKLFQNPFLYWTGTRDFPPLSGAEVERLRAFVEAGGFILVDDALATPGVGFDRAFQRELVRLFPGRALQRLPQDHTVFLSYYLIDRVVGRTANRPYLSGLSVGDRTAVIYSGNDLGGAWARDRGGKFLNAVEPGGELQREQAFRLGINIILYATCMDYKKDLIHTPFISKRRRGKD